MIENRSPAWPSLFEWSGLVILNRVSMLFTCCFVILSISCALLLSMTFVCECRYGLWVCSALGSVHCPEPLMKVLFHRMVLELARDFHFHEILKR